MFRYIPPILDLLEEIDPKEYPGYYYLYLHIGRDYERAVRYLKKALRIIAKTSNPYMEEFYEQVGFHSRTSFYRTFKQITGLSPREFKDKA